MRSGCRLPRVSLLGHVGHSKRTGLRGWLGHPESHRPVPAGTCVTPSALPAAGVVPDLGCGRRSGRPASARECKVGWCGSGRGSRGHAVVDLASSVCPAWCGRGSLACRLPRMHGRRDVGAEAGRTAKSTPWRSRGCTLTTEDDTRATVAGQTSQTRTASGRRRAPFGVRPSGSSGR